MIAISTQNLCLAQTFLLRLRLETGTLDLLLPAPAAAVVPAPKDDEDEAAGNLQAMRPIYPWPNPLSAPCSVFRQQQPQKREPTNVVLS